MIGVLTPPRPSWRPFEKRSHWRATLSSPHPTPHRATLQSAYTHDATLAAIKLLTPVASLSPFCNKLDYFTPTRTFPRLVPRLVCCLLVSRTPQPPSVTCSGLPDTLVFFASFCYYQKCWVASSDLIASRRRSDVWAGHALAEVMVNG